MDLVVHAPRAVLPAGEAAVTVGVTGGRITAVEPFDADLPATRQLRLADDEVLMPGLVDTHVHINDPGRAEWEGFTTATQAAAAGGVTTVLDMPLNSIPPTLDVDSLRVKREAAAGRVHVDVGFWGGATPDNLGQLDALHAAGVFGFKCFLLPSGVPEFAELDEQQLAHALREVGPLGVSLLVHAEDPEAIGPVPSSRSYSDFLASRPAAAENFAIVRLIELARETGASVHVVHLSSADVLPALAEARRDGVRLTVETCPHYLTFAAEEVPDGATGFKCCPPIRESANREALWQGLLDGVIDDVVSDHSPCPPELKRLDTGDFAAAWGGISGLQLGLPAVWTAARSRGVPLTSVVRWMAQRPADRVGLRAKGRITLGADADLCIFAPDAQFTVDAVTLRHRHPVSAYQGMRLSGVVRSTWLRGVEVGGGRPRGQLLTR